MDVPVTPPSSPSSFDDVVRLQSMLGLSVMEMLSFLPMQRLEYDDAKKHRDEPLSSISLALLVRALNRHPDLAWWPKAPEPMPVFRRIVTGLQAAGQQAPSLGEFSLALGLEYKTAYRWKDFEEQGKFHPLKGKTINTLILLTKLMDKMGEVKGWFEWQSIAEIESTSRGNSSIFTDRKWPKKAAKPRKSKSKDEQDPQ